MPPILTVQNLKKNFKGLTAVADYSVTLEAGKIYGLIGPNGAGKTTVFNLLSGEQRPTAGSISLRGRDIAGESPHVIATRGMARTFQNLRLFGTMTVMDNVLVAAQMHKGYGFAATIFGLPALRRGEVALREQVMTYLEAMGLAAKADHAAASLPYGEQRKLEIARALATRPQLLLLDEPAAGMNPSESVELMATIEKVRDVYDLTILLIEHDMRVVMNLCQHLQVLCYGSIIAEGSPEEIKNNPQVIEAYLGRRVADARA
ncbi:MAG: ABC transporter ATP-binding protein [Methylocystaceae bacterium]